MAESVDQLPPGAFHPLASNWCHSVGEPVKVDFEWTIHDYEFRGPGKCLRSTKFPAAKVHDQTTVRWNLFLNDIGLWLESSPPPTQDMRVKTAFVNAKREKVFSKEIVTKNSDIQVNPTLRDTRLDKSKELIVNGALTIYCEIEIYKGEKKLSGQTAAYGISQPLNDGEELLKDFQKLFESMELSDVTFNVRCQEFRAHKTILAARSPVFAAMFKHPSKEKLLGNVDVPDIEPGVFKELLRYIYTGQVPLQRMDKLAIGLLAAADKYLLEKLKKACGDHLVKNICKNCAELLSLNENHPAHFLKEIALHYFRQFPAEVTATDSWKKAIMEKPDWVVNIKDMLFESLFQQSKADK